MATERPLSIFPVTCFLSVCNGVILFLVWFGLLSDLALDENKAISEIVQVVADAVYLDERNGQAIAGFSFADMLSDGGNGRQPVSADCSVVAGKAIADGGRGRGRGSFCHFVGPLVTCGEGKLPRYQRLSTFFCLHLNYFSFSFILCGMQGHEFLPAASHRRAIRCQSGYCQARQGRAVRWSCAGSCGELCGDCRLEYPLPYSITISNNNKQQSMPLIKYIDQIKNGRGKKPKVHKIALHPLFHAGRKLPSAKN